MTDMQLSERMERLASWVTDGHRLADIGTDHGYIPIALVLRRRIPSALAMDVNRGPLSRAEEHIRSYGLDTYIETRLSDGLKKLRPGEADTVLIAGMGGALTVRILNGGTHCLHTVQELILQPQSEIRSVREWLWEHDYQIIEEDMVKDEGKYYPMMKAVHGEDSRMSAAELAYGRTGLQRSPDVLQEYLQREEAKNQKVMEVLQANGKEASDRMRALEEERAQIMQVRLELKKQ